MIRNCVGDVIITSSDGDIFNMKSALSKYTVLSRLLSEQGDNLEIFACNCNEEGRIINFLIDLDNNKYY